MSIEISKRTEARLLAKAQEQGLSVEALIDRLLGGLPKRSTRVKPWTYRAGILELRAVCNGTTYTKMPVEPGVLDAKILVYAVDSEGTAACCLPSVAGVGAQS